MAMAIRKVYGEVDGEREIGIGWGLSCNDATGWLIGPGEKGGSSFP